MFVAAHGNVDAYCESHDMAIVERYTGNVEDYNGKCRILVTDNCEDLNEYYYMKYKLLGRKIELISTHWSNSDVGEFVAYLDRRRVRDQGRVAFGFKREDGKIVEDPETIGIARRIIELRDLGWTYKKIAEEEGIRHPDGRKMNISTLQVILRNREKYR